ncbi:uncharacterized protein LOC143275048 [Babylonia areolata]|uniref:uncharacterized protein LOC143275048 n=1 Tax=Babylonia areolata TaxID=304850 RepID=UPI003FD242BD
MDRHDLPGIENLFRQHERLARKLSQEELNALRRYVQRTVHTECQSVVARMRYLQSAQDANESQYQHALRALQKDLHVQRSVAGEFRRELGSLARVLAAREERSQARHETLTRQVVAGREEVKEAGKRRGEGVDGQGDVWMRKAAVTKVMRTQYWETAEVTGVKGVTGGCEWAKEALEAELEVKEKELNHQKDMVVDLEDQLAAHRDCHKLRQEVAQLRKDLLKVKMDNDKLTRQLVAQTTTTTTTNTKLVDRETGRLTRPKPKPTDSPNLPLTKRLTKPVATFTPVTPYCTSSVCRARQDLEECRAQLIKKCEEVVYLKAVMAQLKKTEASRGAERTCSLPVPHPVDKALVDKDKASVHKVDKASQPVRPANHRRQKERLDGGLCSGRDNADPRVCAALKFKLGPVLPRTEKK